MRETVKRLCNHLQNIAREGTSREVLLRVAIDGIRDLRPVYHWVGIYLLDSDGQSLSLFPYYHGRPTPHVHIPVDQGICGAAVRENRTLIVDDVNQDPRYLACSLETRSEIVVPIRTPEGDLVGEIDIDSDVLAAFTHQDREALESVAEVLGRWWDRLEDPSPTH
jgi:GAF domain-containing protein